jgi:hypothetical protein
MRSVLNLRRSVKTTTDTPSAATTVNAFFLLIVPSERDPPTIMGRSGNMQGAKTVKTPAINVIKRSSIVFYVRKKYCAICSISVARVGGA